MALFHRFAFVLSLIGMIGAVIVLLAMTGLILTEVVLRTWYASSTHMADELVGYGIGAMSFLALGQSLEKGTLIRMNLLISWLRPKGPVRFAVELLCIGFGLFSCGMAFWFFTRNVLRNYERGYVSETVAQVPLWLPEAFISIGLAILLVQFLSYFLRVLSGEIDLSSEKAAELGIE
ncbi:TRAP transporter small permease [Pelagibius sp. Alg239-R121]|uniref:TRAP transporter small permease n=1 Tax=Pelagibius sp. Alg239-R121 TaxID=2993448 RepID=UPI0024A6877A|nr:TRAP transporter small permease [Pelagibius sp. Alg239-R121]